MKYRPTHVIEYIALRAASAALRVLPYRVALCLGWGLAGLAFLLMRQRVREAQRRIRQVFGPGLPRRDVRRIAWQSLRNLVFTAIETMRGPRMTRAWVASVSNFVSATAGLAAHVRSGRGAILACAHMGNWEFAGAASNLHGIPVFSMGGRQRNPLFDRLLNRLRERSGMKTLVRGSTSLAAIIRELKGGGVFAILSDVRMPTPALPIRFLGGEANIGPGLAMFAYHASVPVFPCVILRDGWTRHRLAIGQPIWPSEGADKRLEARRITQAVFDILDRAIREDPGQWFWFNRRWILDPLAPAASDGASRPTGGTGRSRGSDGEDQSGG